MNNRIAVAGVDPSLLVVLRSLEGGGEISGEVLEHLNDGGGVAAEAGLVDIGVGAGARRSYLPRQRSLCPSLLTSLQADSSPEKKVLSNWKCAACFLLKYIARTNALLPDMPIVYASEAFLKLTGYILPSDIAENVAAKFREHKLRVSKLPTSFNNSLLCVCLGLAWFEWKVKAVTVDWSVYPGPLPVLLLFKMEDVIMGMWVENFNSSRLVEYVHSLKFCQYGCVEDPPMLQHPITPCVMDDYATL
ncbi:hypothetical protein SASPL_110550 [Salvia splendens]|uniref:Uncharacterized protein n=1 Tax=Salvia splendens TaxID=180675 RepID=A0A8X9A2U1_SALSN|nr:hypothetical protein SASPL_110550 [Salvia splendens]